MDLNYLIHREGVERLRAQTATSLCAQLAHLGMADMFRDRIDFRRRTAGSEAGQDRDGRAPAG
jgi:hypothetical protein